MLGTLRSVLPRINHAAAASDDTKAPVSFDGGAHRPRRRMSSAAGLGFLDGELRRGIGFEPLIRNRQPAADGAPVCAVV